MDDMMFKMFGGISSEGKKQRERNEIVISLMFDTLFWNDGAFAYNQWRRQAKRGKYH